MKKQNNIFKKYQSLSTLNIQSFNVNNETSMFEMFLDCKPIEYLNTIRRYNQWCRGRY